MAPTGVAFPGRLGLSCITICQKKKNQSNWMHLTMFTDCGTGGGSVFKVGNGCLGRDLGMIYSRLRCGGRRMGELNLFFFLKKKTDLKGRRVPWWWPSPGRRWNGVPVLLLCVLPMNERNNEKWSSFLCVGPRVSFLFFFFFFYRVAVTRTRMSRLVFFFLASA